jgi:RND family efflux transporter MFP subunit
MPRVRPFFPAAAAVVAALSLAGCKPDAVADPSSAERLVQVFTVQPNADSERTFTGVIAARVQSDLGFRVQGKVVQRLVDTGQSVKAGQPLMRIDQTDLDLAITARDKAVASAKAVVIQAASDEKRYADLRSKGWATDQKYEQVRATLDTASAQLAATEADAQVARNQSGYSLLLADADGTVVETLAEPGQVVAQGQTVVRLAHFGPREAVIDLPETLRPALGSAAQVSLYGDPVRTSATLRQLSDAADPRTRTYEARYVLQGDGARAALGVTVTVTIATPQESAAMQVPIGAIDDRGKGPGIWVLDGTASTVAFRPVKVGQFGRETAAVSDGIRPGETVVAMGGYLLREGEHVRVIASKAAMQ